MKKILTILLSILAMHLCAQKVESVITVPVNTWGGTEQALLYKPSIVLSKYPLLVFLHGSGEAGSNLSAIYGSSSAGGPAYYIEQGQWPSNYPFYVLSPQASTWSTTAPELDVLLQYMITHYPIDSLAIYLTGLSAGGDGLYEYTAHINVTPRYPAAAIVPMSIATNTSDSGVYWTLHDKVPVWGFGSESDVWGVQTHLYITGAYSGNTGVTPPGLGSDGIFTSYSGGHCCWMQFYTPTYQSNGNTIYTWMLTHTRALADLPLTYVKLTIDASGALVWTVDDTTDVDHFIIQKSNDDKTFETVGTTTSYSWLPQSIASR